MSEKAKQEISEFQRILDLFDAELEMMAQKSNILLDKVCIIQDVPGDKVKEADKKKMPQGIISDFYSRLQVMRKYNDILSESIDRLRTFVG